MTTKLIFSSVGAILISAATAGAQSPIQSRWDAFAGCWAPVFVEGTATSVESPKLCVVPTAANAADIVAVLDGKVTERHSVVADGARRDVTRDGCAGWETASWSDDGRRVFLKAEQSCPTAGASGKMDLRRLATGIFAIAPDGDWLNVSGVSANGGGGTRVVRYSAVPADGSIPAEIGTALQGRLLAQGTARVAAQAPVTLENVIEASRAVDSSVVAAWIGGRAQPFSVDVAALRKLKNAGVASSIIDVVVAVSHPKYFALLPGAAGDTPTRVQSSTSRRDPGNVAALPIDDCRGYMFDPYGYNYSLGCDPLRRYGRYGYGSRYMYGSYYNPYDPYGYGYGYSGYSGRPVVVVVRGSSDDPARPHGRVDRTRGYTRGTSDGSSPTSTRATTTGSSGSTTGTQSTTSGSGSSSGGGGSTAGTAKPRPPGL